MSWLSSLLPYAKPIIENVVTGLIPMAANWLINLFRGDKKPEQADNINTMIDAVVRQIPGFDVFGQGRELMKKSIGRIGQIVNYSNSGSGYSQKKDLQSEGYDSGAGVVKKKRAQYLDDSTYIDPYKKRIIEQSQRPSEIVMGRQKLIGP